MRTVARGRCAECGRMFTLTRHGVIRTHYGPSGWHEHCHGGGRKPADGTVVSKEMKQEPRAWWWGVTTDQFIEPLHRTEEDAYQRAKQLVAITPRSESVRIYTFELGSWTLHDTLAGAR